MLQKNHVLTQLLFVHLAEERQDHNAKRRKLEQQNSKSGFATGPSPTISLTTQPTAPTSILNPVPPVHPSLPQRPSYDFAAKADSIGLGASPTAQSIRNVPTALQALAGSNRDIVANRGAIRMANMSAADVLRAELSGPNLVKLARSLPVKPVSAPPSVLVPNASLEASPMSISPAVRNIPPPSTFPDDDSDDVPGLGNHRSSSTVISPLPDPKASVIPEDDADADGELDPDAVMANVDNAIEVDVLAGAKRKFEEGPVASDEADDTIAAEEDDEASPDVPLALKVNADGTVEQEDKVKFVNHSPFLGGSD